MNEAANPVEVLCREAADALIQLDLNRALRAVVRVRHDFDPAANPLLAVQYLKALRIEAFIRSNTEEEPLDQEFAHVAMEIKTLAQRADAGLPAGIQCAAALVDAQEALLGSRYPVGFWFLHSMLTRDVIRQRISDLAPRPLLPAEKLEAAIIVDAYGELARVLQRFYLLPFGISHRRADASRALLLDGPFRTLLNNSDVSRWSRRRTFTRMAYLAVTRGERPDGRTHLETSRLVLSPNLGEAPLAQLEYPVTEFYDELAKDDGRCDPYRAEEILETAAAHLDRAGFHRAEAELELEAELLQLRLR